jgi:PAS domain S-box-containing protein
VLNPDAAVRSALHLAAIVESSEDAIISKDLNGIIVSWNRAAARMFGYEAAEVIGKSIRILIPADRQYEEDAVLARIRAGNVVDHFETIRVRKDGSRLDISLTVSPIRTTEGTIVGASKIARDITERKLIEAALAAVELQNRILGDVSELLGRSLDLRETLTAVVRRVARDFGDACSIEIASPEEPIERYSNVAPPLPTPDQVIRTGAPVVRPSLISIPLRVHAGVIGAITFTTSASGRTYTERDVRFATSVAERVALAVENARAYEQVSEANRLKDDFLATLSHELRTPLNAIVGYTRMLRTKAIAPARESGALAVVERNALALAQIVNDVFDISRVVTGKLAVRVQPIMLSRLIDDSIATLLPAAAARGVEIRSSVAPDVQTIVADPDRMQQVLWNLLSNAVKFTSRGGEVVVQAVRHNASVDIQVRDTGEGIPPDFLPFVFERFRQAHTRKSGMRSGLGIGLAIARHIVEMHGGTIEAASEGLGKGSTFRVKLPAAATASESESTLPRSATGGRRS